MKAFLKIILYQPLFNVLAFLIWLLPGNSAALGIITLTVILRLLLLPSTKSTILAQKKMKSLQGEIERIKEEHKDDRQKQSMAIMQFYRTNGINPVSSCLPMLIQMPILIILYYVFRSGLTTDRYAELLYSFTPHADTINTWFFWTDLSSPDKFFILPVLAGLLQFIQTRQMTAKRKAKRIEEGKSDELPELQQAMQNQMLYVMPIMTVLISLKLPAALPLYWIITTLFMVVQQKFLLRDGNIEKNSVQVSIRRKEA